MKTNLKLSIITACTLMLSCGPKSENKVGDPVEYPGIDANGDCQSVTIGTWNSLVTASNNLFSTNDETHIPRVLELCEKLRSLIKDKSCKAVELKTENHVELNYGYFMGDCVHLIDGFDFI
jgi:hypothetical protein